MIVREVFDNGVRLITETMDHVRSVSVGVWLTRGSRHEPIEHGGIAHFVEHMLFKGTGTPLRRGHRAGRSTRSAATSTRSPSKEYAGYYIKVLDEHLPIAIDVLSDLVLNPAFRADDVEREKKVILEEIKMVEDTPDDLVHELFTQSFWGTHPLGRPILGTAETVDALTPQILREYFEATYSAGHLVIAAVGNVTHERMRELVSSDLRPAPGASARRRRPAARRAAARAGPGEGSRAEPRLPRHEQLPAEPRRSLRRAT